MLKVLLQTMNSEGKSNLMQDEVEKDLNEALHSLSYRFLFDFEDQVLELLNIKIYDVVDHVFTLECSDEEGFAKNLKVFYKSPIAKCDCKYNKETMVGIIDCPTLPRELMDGVIGRKLDKIYSEEKNKLELMASRVYFMMKSKNPINASPTGMVGKFMEIIFGDTNPKISKDEIFYITGLEDHNGLISAHGIEVSVDEWRYAKYFLLQLGSEYKFNPEDYKDQLDDSFWKLYPQP